MPAACQHSSWIQRYTCDQCHILPAEPEPAQEKWCLWHRDCKKAEFEYEALKQDLFIGCWVDDLEEFHGDVAGVPPRDKVLDCLHANKNALNGWTRALWDKYPEQRLKLGAWLLKHKRGMRCLVPAAWLLALCERDGHTENHKSSGSALVPAVSTRRFRVATRQIQQVGDL